MTYTIEQYRNREEYARSIFMAIDEVIDADPAEANEAVKLTAIKNMAQVGIDGAVLSDGDDFSSDTVSMWLHEAETELSDFGADQPKAKALMQVHFAIKRLEALLESIHTVLHEASEEQVGDAAMLAGWGAEIAGEIANDLDIYNMQRSKGKPVY